MKEQLFKKNYAGDIVAIAVCGILIAVSFLARNIMPETLDEIIFNSIKLAVTLFGICAIGYSIYDIVRTISWNHHLVNLPYLFNYNLEYAIYDAVRAMNPAKGKTIKEIKKRDIAIPQKYTDWRSRIEKEYALLISSEDFYRFLTSIKRSRELQYDAITTVAVPIEITLIATIAALSKNQIGSLVTCGALSIYVVILISKEMRRAKMEVHFINDLIEILHK